MAIGNGGSVRGHLRALFHAGAVRELTDGQLLERFASGPGEGAELAFAALVERHGPMVLRVCRGVLADSHDTQDAFQATFLVLVKKARGLWVRDSLGPWLNQVAYRTASCARTGAARRRRHERAAASSEVAQGRSSLDDDLRRALHEEIHRLHERFRAPLVLCDLEGQSHEQAARCLGLPVGTVKSRLSRARDRLRHRLSRRGVSPLVGAFWLDPADGLVLEALAEATTSAAVRGVIRGSAFILAREVLNGMFITRWFKIATVMLVAGATVPGLGLIAGNATTGQEPGPGELPKAQAVADDSPAVAVKPGPARFTITERGSLEASRSESVFNRIEGQTTILYILPEGKAVKKGDLVCALDTAKLKDQLANQSIATRNAEAAYQNAKLTREVAQIAVVEYQEGIYKQELQTLTDEIAEAQSAIKKAEGQLERGRRAQKRVSELPAKDAAKTAVEIVAELDIEDRVEAAELTILREKSSLERAQTRQVVLTKYTHDLMVKRLDGEVVKDRFEELAKQKTWEQEKVKEAKLQTQIESGKLFAPADGLIVHANDPNRLNRTPNIQEGATVRERQILFRVVDLSVPMQVNTKVREAWVDRLTNGQKARVTIDAFPGQEFRGVVTKIQPLPDPSTSFNGGIKVYTTNILLDNGPPGLRPGMSARAEFLIFERENAITIPFTALRPFDSTKSRVAVKKPGGGFDWRDVNIGAGDDTKLEVTQGLNSGDLVIVNPPPALTEDEVRALFRRTLRSPAAKKAARRPPEK